MAWNRLLWGVLFDGADERDPPMMLGAMWHEERRTYSHAYKGEPTRALLFCTRKEARDWCRQKMAEWNAGDSITKKWRVRPLRVRETVEETT